MNTLSKLALGAMGRLRPKPLAGVAQPRIALPPAPEGGGMPLLEALRARRSSRAFSAEALAPAMLGALLWSAAGVNRSDGGRTAPSALGAHEIDLYVALPDGAYRYDPATHSLDLAAHADLRRITGYQDFVDAAPLDLVYVADHARLRLVPVNQRASFSAVAAGAMAQNVYLYAASQGLATVLRAWIDREAIGQALGLDHDCEVLLSQTVGLPACA